MRMGMVSVLLLVAAVVIAWKIVIWFAGKQMMKSGENNPDDQPAKAKSDSSAGQQEHSP